MKEKTKQTNSEKVREPDFLHDFIRIKPYVPFLIDLPIPPFLKRIAAHYPASPYQMYSQLLQEILKHTHCLECGR